MLSELQTIVDSVASRIGRPALIEDHRQRVVAYSEQLEPMDEVRRLSILRRQTTPEVIAFFRKVGIMQARDPIRTPACEELQMLPRIAWSSFGPERLVRVHLAGQVVCPQRAR